MNNLKKKTDVKKLIKKPPIDYTWLVKTKKRNKKHIKIK